METKIETLILLVNEENANIRIDKYLSENIEKLTRNYIVKLMSENLITVNNKPVDKKYKTKIGDMITVSIPDPISLDVIAEDIPLEIVYEDKDLLVINKNQGMVVHPANGNYTGTLVNALMSYCKDLSGINGVSRPGIVHRIDKNTSGLLIVAKNDNAHLSLAKQIKEHSFKRQYEAIVIGNLKQNEGTINQPIGRNSSDRKKMSVTHKNSKPAVTHFKVLGRYNGYTHIQCTLETGRTHQIRVHLSYIGYPILGDDVYGKKDKKFDLIGQCLHAKVLGFIHPSTNEYLEFTSDLPTYFKEILKTI